MDNYSSNGCKLQPALRYVSDKNGFEIVIYHFNTLFRKIEDIYCYYKVPFDVINIDLGNFSIFWACVQLNDSFFDDMLLVLKTVNNMFDEKEIMPNVKKILKNKTSILDREITRLSAKDKHKNMVKKDLCNEYKCPKPKIASSNVLVLVCISLIIIILVTSILFSIK